MPRVKPGTRHPAHSRSLPCVSVLFDRVTVHGYALGMMYQLTGDKAWADKAAAWAQATIDGQVQSRRWGWHTTDGGYMRVGPSVAATAAACATARSSEIAPMSRT